MLINPKKINSLFVLWLSLSLVLVFLIIIIGGLTRLTDSGLSITEWELISGILPPLNENSWLYYFDQYKKIPQYKLLNFDMNIDEFKVIFYWEYFHRIFARFIGIFFLLPLIYFHFSKKINIKHIKICYMILSLIILQGIIGWYMVSSGLINNTSVSHYRLSLHLSIAIVITTSIFWLIKNFLSNTNKTFFNLSTNNLPFLILVFLIFIQIILGAFVSGLDAGKIYQTWPLMGNTYYPDDLSLENSLDFDSHSLVQFYHRNLAYLIILYVISISIFVYKKKISYLFKSIKIFNFFLLLQVILGVLTLISGLNIYLASLHQITSVLLILSALNLYFLRVK